MGRRRRPRPIRLAEKLLQIRNTLDGGISQDEMARRLEVMNPGEKIDRIYVSKFERAVAEPSAGSLLAYARLAGVYVDALLDDDLDLPGRLPCQPKTEGIRRARASRGNR